MLKKPDLEKLAQSNRLLDFQVYQQSVRIYQSGAWQPGMGNSFGFKHLTPLGKEVWQLVKQFAKRTAFKGWNTKGLRFKFDLSDADEASVRILSDRLKELLGEENVWMKESEGGRQKGPRWNKEGKCIPNRRVVVKYLTIHVR